MLQVLNRSPVDAPLGARLTQASAELAQFLATCKPSGMSSSEKRVNEIRVRREATVSLLANARAEANRTSAGRLRPTDEERAFAEQIAQIDAELDRSRRPMLAARDAFSARYPAMVNEQLKSSAPALRQAADAIEALQGLLKQIDTFAWRNGLEIPRYSDALLSAADLRRLADRIKS